MTQGRIKGRILNITKEMLYDDYVVQKMTATEIGEKYGCHSSFIGILQRRYEITHDMQLGTYRITSEQRDLMIGGCLGDGCITRTKTQIHYHYFECHAEDEVEYLRWKFAKLIEFCRMTGVKQRNKTGYNKQNMYYMETRGLPCFDEFRTMTICDLVDSLNQNSFLIWMMDDGNLDKKWYRIGLARCTLDELNYVISALGDKFGLNGTIAWSNKSQGKFNGIKFNLDDSIRIAQIMQSSVFYNDVVDIMQKKFTSLHGWGLPDVGPSATQTTHP